MARTCQKITRITAKADSKEISMLTDIVISSRRVLRQAFLLNRDSEFPTDEQSGDSTP